MLITQLQLLKLLPIGFVPDIALLLLYKFKLVLCGIMHGRVRFSLSRQEVSDKTLSTSDRCTSSNHTRTIGGPYAALAHPGWRMTIIRPLTIAFRKPLEGASVSRGG